jgi:hypothetical protein
VGWSRWCLSPSTPTCALGNVADPDALGPAEEPYPYVQRLPDGRIRTSARLHLTMQVAKGVTTEEVRPRVGIGLNDPEVFHFETVQEPIDARPAALEEDGTDR